MIQKMTAWCLVLGLAAACDDPISNLAEFQSACRAGSAEACTKAAAIAREIEPHQFRLDGPPSPATPGCQQGAEGELTCVRNI